MVRGFLVVSCWVAGSVGRGEGGAAAEESQLRNKPVLVLCVPAAGAAG